MPLCSYDIKMSDLQTLGSACLASIGNVVRCAAGGRGLLNSFNMEFSLKFDNLQEEMRFCLTNSAFIFATFFILWKMRGRFVVGNMIKRIFQFKFSLIQITLHVADVEACRKSACQTVKEFSLSQLIVCLLLETSFSASKRERATYPDL